MLRSPADIYDELLALRCQRHDAEAWDELVRRYNARLLYFVRRLVNSDDQAAQLMQDVWLHALKNMTSLRQADRLAPWLYAIARRVAMSHFRRKYSRPAQALADAADGICDEELDASTLFENAELVHYGLARLGQVEREALTLYFLQDLSIEEIARVLEVPRGTVKSRLSRARRELRRVLENEAGLPAQEEPR